MTILIYITNTITKNGIVMLINIKKTGVKFLKKQLIKYYLNKKEWNTKFLYDHIKKKYK